MFEGVKTRLINEEVKGKDLSINNDEWLSQNSVFG